MTNAPVDLPTNAIYFKDLSNGYQVAITVGEPHKGELYAPTAMLISGAVVAVFAAWWLVKRKKSD
jgi:hypothetical protein